MDPIRINYNKCDEHIFATFISNIKKDGRFVIRAHNPASETTMQDRYTLSRFKSRISVVYETKAQTLVITAPQAAMDDLIPCVPSGVEPTSDRVHTSDEQSKGHSAPSEPKVHNPDRDRKEHNGRKESDGTNKGSQGNNKNTDVRTDDFAKTDDMFRIGRSDPTNKSSKDRAETHSALPEKAGKGQAPAKKHSETLDRHEKPNVKSGEDRSKSHSAPSDEKGRNKSPIKKEVKGRSDNNDGKGENNFERAQTSGDRTGERKSMETRAEMTKADTSKRKTVKSSAAKSGSNGAKKSDAFGETKGIVNTFTIKKVSEEKFRELLSKIKASKNMRYKQKPSDVGPTYLVTSHNEKATVRYAGGDIQLGGSRGDLYSELQLMMSQVSDYKTAINSHIKATGEVKRPAEVEKQLRRKLPSAFEFLSEQSKIDLAIAILDITNPAVVLSDYSTLLIPCFRGLERLIFDLQHAQGIVVKMIGQAYEKENGVYVLKSGYRRKIPSVIYAEVMAALYSEYFTYRNFYSHSDGGYDNLSRVISDKGQVQSIFNHIMEVINYNGKKLKEIGFRI